MPFAMTVTALLIGASARAELIPADRLVDWTPGVAVGVPGGIDQYLPGGTLQRTHLIDVTQAPYSADATGATDASPTIQAAINAASPGDVVYLPTGTYRINSTLKLGPTRSGITLRGTGDGTVIMNYAASMGISVGSSSDYNWSWPTTGNVVTGGLTKGSTQLTIGNTSAFSVGQMAQLRVDNDPSLPVVSVSGFEGMRRQMTRVIAKTATTLTIYPALYTDYSATTATVHVAQLQANAIGIEDLLIDSSNSAATFTIWLEQCYGCWVKNVHIRHSANYHVFVNDSLNCEVRHCYLDHLNHSGSNGAGLLVNTVSGSLFEDNIIVDAMPLIEVNAGSCGNVIAYNYADISLVPFDTNHGPHNEFNLYEGNVTPGIISDGYFGSASDDTFFRNWITGVNNGAATYTVALKRFTRDYSFAGNILGTSGKSNGMYSFGQPNMGNGSFSGSVQPSAGIDWPDLHLTGTLTTRTADGSGVVILDHGTGDLAVNQWPITVQWNGLTRRDWETVQAVNSPSVTLGDGASASTGTVLPAQGTAIRLWPGAPGFQELDLDVEPTTLRKGNYLALATGGGAVPATEALNGDPLPSSLFRTSKPVWFGALAWPAFDPFNPNQNADAIPAGYRFVHGTDPTSPTNGAPSPVQQPFNVRTWRQRQ